MNRRTIDEMTADARRRLDRLTPDAAFAEQQAGALIVDTRCAELRRDDGAIPGAWAVPLSVLYWRLDPASEFRDAARADTSRRVILVCAHGYSSSLAAATLLDLGFERPTDVVGGFEAWAAAGLPVETGPG